MPKIVQITEAFTDALSLVALGDNGRAYKYDGTDKSWTILPELPNPPKEEQPERTNSLRYIFARDEQRKRELMKMLIEMEYCDNCANQRSGQCLYCEATETNPKPTQFIPMDLKAHADGTGEIK